MVQFMFNIGARFFPWRKAILVEGAGSIGKIPDLLREAGVRKPLIVTDPGVFKAGIAAAVTDILSVAGVSYAQFSEVEHNPSIDTVNTIFSFYNAEHCDGFIALGGGSAIDAAKGAAARAARPRRTVDQLMGLSRVLKKIPPFIAVPTTAGTGSETTIAALISDTATHHKRALMDISLIPLYAVLDPELTLKLPPAITATTGMDALTHAVESYLCWTCRTSESIAFALDAVKIIFANLEKVYKNGGDIERRQAMLLAAYKAGFAFTRAGVGNIHAIAHTLGGLYNTSHGLANAVILPKVLENYGTAVHKKLARLAEAAGIVSTGQEGDAAKAKCFIDAIYGMNERMGIPKGFDFIKDEDIPRMVQWADKESNPLYPVPVLFSQDRFRSVIETIRIKKD
jgi:alcohol dehydrogenase class IV